MGHTVDTAKIMKIFILAFLAVIAVSSSEGLSGRHKRDLTCAGAGQKGCSFTCKARGWKDGNCTWITDTGRADVGQFKCECDKERRGIRCVHQLILPSLHPLVTKIQKPNFFTLIFVFVSIK